jgi:pimeloyl-ACP methyl ester carboxylesterase
VDQSQGPGADLRAELEPSADVLPAQGDTGAVVLVLHGGKANSFEASAPSHLSRRRLQPFAKSVHAKGAASGVSVWQVRYRYRGWNGAQMSAAHDAQWALDEVRRRHGDVPVVLLGHSMGGRAAAHVLGDPSVIGMVALCPWLPHEPWQGAAGKKVAIAHAVGDRWTSPSETRDWATAAASVAASLFYVQVRHSGHFMLRRSGLWTDLATGITLSWLGVHPSVGRAAANVLAEASAGATALSV